MSTSSPDDDKRALYLHGIDVSGTSKRKVRIKLDRKEEDIEENVDLCEHASRWIPANICQVPVTGSFSVHLKADGVALGGLEVGNQEATMEISGTRIIEEFLKSISPSNALNFLFAISEIVRFNNDLATVTLVFYPSQLSETARQALDRMKVAMEEYSQLKPNKAMRSALKLGLAASKAFPYTKGAISIARATYDLLSEQQKYDGQVSGLVSRIEKILGFFKKVEEVSYDRMGLTMKEMEQMNELVVKTADFACIYVQRSFVERLTRSAMSPADQKRVDELQMQLDNLIGEFNRAIETETLKKTDTKLLLKRLKPVDAGYNDMRICMEGTRERLINKIVTWAVEPVGATPWRKQSTNKRVLWLYGMPGIGKTSVAHSICARLDAEKNLGGSFFCRRDDPKLGDPQYVLPTLTCQLAEIWGPFRRLVTEELLKDPQITPQSTGGELLTKLLKSLQNHPPHPLVLVIDALDECGGNRTRKLILQKAFDATLCVPWLKVIITSRQEPDINEFFQQLDSQGRCLLEDISTDDSTHDDLRHFTRKRLSSIAAAPYLKHWPPEHLVDDIVMRAHGLYIFVDTLWGMVRDEPDPEDILNQALKGTAGDALGDLYMLYSSIFHSRVGRDSDGFKEVMGAILVVESYRPLDAQAIAILVGRRFSMVQTLVTIMSPLLHQDGTKNGEIRFRHLSIAEFLTGPSCPEEFRVDIQRAHGAVALGCLKTMLSGLKFNICRLRSSFLSNEEVEDMKDRVNKNIPAELQYSCMHWSNHLALLPYPAHSDTIGKLNEFVEGVQLLYWIEALSVMGEVSNGIRMLLKVSQWIKGPRVSMLDHLDDALRFCLDFREAIVRSTPHMYISGLSFTPRQSLIWKKASKSFEKLLEVEKGQKRRWPARASKWTGHTSKVSSLSYSPDGQYVVSGSYDTTIRVWNAETGVPAGEPLKGHTGLVHSVAYSPDGRRVVSGSDDNTIWIWDMETGVPVGEPLKGHTGSISSVAYSPDGRYVVSSSDDHTLRIWNAETGVSIGEPLKGHTGPVYDVAYSPDGRHVVSGSYDDTIRIWDAEKGIPAGEPLKGHDASVYSVAYSPDGEYVVSGSNDHTIRIWNVRTKVPVGEPLRGHTGRVSCVAYSPDGLYVVSSSDDDTIRIWNARTGAPVGEPLEGDTGSVSDVAYSPDGRYLVSGSDDHTVRIWDAEKGVPIGEPSKGHTGCVSSAVYSPDGLHIVSGSGDQTIRIWDAETGTAVGEPLRGHTGWVSSVAYSPDGLRIVSSSSDTTIRIWNAETGDPVGEPLKGHTGWVSSASYSPDGRYIVSSSHDNTICIWDAETGAPIGKPLEGDTGSISSIAYSPDGLRIVTGSDDYTARIWDAGTGAPVGKPLQGHTEPISSVAYSPDGRHIVSGSEDTTIRIWDTQKEAPVGVPLMGHTQPITSVAYSPDGRHIVSGSDDETTRIWDAKTGVPLGEPLKGHTGWVCSVAYSPDGRHVVSGADDHTIRIWDAKILADSTTTAFHPDNTGWVHHPDGGLFFWVPQEYRNGLACRAILTIPTEGSARVVRLDLGNACFGTSWEKIKANDLQ